MRFKQRRSAKGSIPLQPSHTLVLYTNHLPKSRGERWWNLATFGCYSLYCQNNWSLWHQKLCGTICMTMQHSAIMSWIIEGAEKAIKANFKQQWTGRFIFRQSLSWSKWLVRDTSWVTAVKLATSCQENQENHTVSIVPIVPKHGVLTQYNWFLFCTWSRQGLNENGQVKGTTFWFEIGEDGYDFLD